MVPSEVVRELEQELELGKKCLGIRLNTSVSRFNWIAFMFASILLIAAFVFVNAAQPALLESVLHIPRENQGSTTGRITLFGELSLMLCVGLWGVLSDRIGRKIVFATGYIIMAVSLVLQPRSPTLEILICGRMLFGIGAGACSAMLVAILSDYPTDASRGKASGLVGVSGGVGALLAAIGLLALPNLFQSIGWDPLSAIYGAYGVTAGLCVLGAIISIFALKSFTVKVLGPKKTMRETCSEALSCAASDPDLGLAYGAGFIARGDAAVLTVFLSLWITSYVLDDLHQSQAEAVARAGMVTGVAQLLGLVSAPIIGWLADKFNRTFFLTISSALAALAYGLFSAVSIPTSPTAFACVAAIGVAQLAVIISTQALLSSRSPETIRGSTSGFFGFCGSLGIIFATQVGGVMYDKLWPASPFLLYGIGNGLIAVWGLVLCAGKVWNTLFSGNDLQYEPLTTTP